MTDRLVRALQNYRAAKDADAVVRAEEQIEEALNTLAEDCRRMAIVACAQIARKRGAGNVAEDIEQLLQE